MFDKLKTLVSSKLKEAIAKFTVGDPKDTVRGDILEGDLTLTNLVLNAEALDLISDALPFDAASVTVERVELKLPWEELNSATTNVVLSGVRIFVVSRLVERPPKPPESPRQPSKGLPSFVIRLVNKLVDNLQVVGVP